LGVLAGNYGKLKKAFNEMEEELATAKVGTLILELERLGAHRVL
jgi:hypothetical protein